MPTRSGLFPRSFKKTFPIASRGEGCWIIDKNGRRFLDASGQAAVVSIGHGVGEIGRAMAQQSLQIAFAHTSQFHTAPAEKLRSACWQWLRRIFGTADESISLLEVPKLQKQR